VELVGMLPLLLAVVFAASQLLAAGVARELAGHAAEAGAVALLEGGDADDAARRSLPGWARDDVRVAVRDERVDVVVRAPAGLGAVADRLAGRATAWAGEAS
jgi:hypothetical protein